MATIVIAENEFWQPGVDLAAALDRRGHTTIRLIADSGTDPIQARWRNCATQTTPAAVTPQGALTDTGVEVVSGPEVVDWQVSEPIQTWLDDNGFEQRLAHRRSRPLRPQAVIDKWQMLEYLRDAGVPIPATWSSAAEVPRGESGPFLVKVRSGGGGEGIHRIENLAQAPVFGGDHIIQKLYDGQVLDSAGVARDGEVLQLITYRNKINPRRPYAAAFGITQTEDPALAAYTRRVVAALGITGPFALDAVPSPQGPLVIDVNLRIWGCWTACQALGMDVLGAYEHALGLGPRPEEFVGRPGSYAPVLRRPPLDVVTARQRIRWLAAERQEINCRSRWLGRDWRRAALRDSIGWCLRGAPDLSS